ncbi:MAG TPA: hypothetical protein PLU67_05260 [Candidatus Kapabacteria bacterium]|jgi:hypothetical protein|nr:hypothetical protein [Candidatus Kapabacteria bacterium]HOQ48252.1 hypothetical protein [Candidatus Kapabacteria bacterium]HPP40019.1 hypothetical protein [Candidatus Kapabacteria bacterium]
MWIEVFRTGNFNDSKGRPFFADSVTLEAIERTYNAATEHGYEAPLVKGHPKDDAPAYGWVERLARRGNKLLAKLKDLSNEIIEEVREGKYRRVSIALTPELLLRHVGLLGAATPAVDGLATVSFDDGECDCYSFAYDFLNRTDEENEIHTLTEQNNRLNEQIAMLQEKLRKLEYSEFVENFLERNKLLLKNQAMKEKLVDLLVRCDELTHKFREEISFNLAEDIISILDCIKPSAYFSQLSIPNAGKIEHQFEGKKVDENRLEIHRRAIEMTMENPNITYQQALNILQGGENA